jgi:L-malate glycosyltransferase
LFDKPFRADLVDLNPGTLMTEYKPRSPRLDLRFAKKLAENLIEWQTEVVHAHNDTALFYAAFARVLGRLAGTALIGTFRNRPTNATLGARLSTRWAAGRATEIVAVSQELNDRLVRSGWVNRCTTVCNGLGLADFSPIGPVGILRSRFSQEQGYSHRRGAAE